MPTRDTALYPIFSTRLRVYIYKYNSLYYIRVILRYPIIINALYIVADTDNIINILYMRSGVRRFLII